MQNFAQFQTTSKFDVNIFRTDEDIQNRSSNNLPQFFPALGGKSLVNFDPLMSKSGGGIITTQNDFLEDHISASKGAVPLNFYVR